MLRDEMKVTCIKETTPAPVALENIEYRIATHMQGAYENMLEVGRCLNEAKEAGLVPHGQWETWVRKNTGMSERSAQKLMQAARSVLPGSAMAKLPISKIQAILALPEEAREPIAEKAVADDMSLRELQEAVKREKQRADQLAEINEKTAARAAANSRDAERAIREAQELRQKLQEADDRARSLEVTGIDPDLRDANVRAVVAAGGHVVARMPIIPGFTDDEACVAANVARIVGLGISRADVLPFHQLGQGKYDSTGREYAMRDVPQLSEKDVEAVVARCEAAGLEVVVHGE